MHSSTAGMRPRQRTFTSCTECRRRKQRVFLVSFKILWRLECELTCEKCNQAKDRPCNNCARRYPPVVCTYESSRSVSPHFLFSAKVLTISSPPPTIDRIVDFRDDQDSRQEVPSPGPSYVQTSQSSVNVTPTTTVSDGYYNSSYGYYSQQPARTDYYQGESSGASYNASYSSSANYAPVSAGYYQSVPTSYSTPTTSGGYYSSPEQDGAWLSTGDPAAFVGAGSSDYYYVTDPDPGNHQGHASSRP